MRLGIALFACFALACGAILLFARTQKASAPILVDISIEAAKKWQFSPSAQNEQPIAATLKFTLCPGEN